MTKQINSQLKWALYSRAVWYGDVSVERWEELERPRSVLIDHTLGSLAWWDEAGIANGKNKQKQYNQRNMPWHWK